MHAAPLELSGLMLDHFLANKPLPHAWYLMAIGQSYQTYAPGVMPAFERHLLPAYREVYHRMEGSASIAELDALLAERGFSRPLDGLSADYRARLQAAPTCALHTHTHTHTHMHTHTHTHTHCACTHVGCAHALPTRPALRARASTEPLLGRAPAAPHGLRDPWRPALGLAPARHSGPAPVHGLG